MSSTVYLWSNLSFKDQYLRQIDIFHSCINLFLNIIHKLTFFSYIFHTFENRIQWYSKRILDNLEKTWQSSLILALICGIDFYVTITNLNKFFFLSWIKSFLMAYLIIWQRKNKFTVQGIVNKRKQDSIYSVQSSLKSRSL